MAIKLPMSARAAFGSLLAGAMLATPVPAVSQPAAPLPARERDWDRHRDDDGIEVGEVIAGAIVIAGLAAILSRALRDRDYEWRRHGGSRRAIEMCVDAVEWRASREAVLADVTRITRVERRRNGYDVRGELEVYRLYDRHDREGRYDPYDPYGRYERRGRYERYGRYGRYDPSGRPVYARLGTFRCNVRNGEVRSLQVRGLG